MSITIQLNTQADKTADTLRNLTSGLKDVKGGARDAREELEKMKRAEEDQRRLAESLNRVGTAFASLGNAVRQHQTALARTTEIHNRLVAQNAPLAQGFARVAEQIKREHEAAQRAHEVHQRLVAESSPLAQGIAQVAQAIAHEEAVLKRINGPLDQYTKDLAALDALQEKGRITTKQYADEVANLNRQLAQKPKDDAPTMRSGAGAIASHLGLVAGPALAGSFLAIGQGIENLVEESDRLEDTYTNLTNVALKFANNGKTVNVALDEQRDLARSINAEIAPTMELFDGIGDAMRNYGITTKEQIELTRLLGQEMVISNKPVNAAGDLMQKLAVAFELGEGAGRAFKTILADYPELADAAAQAFNTDINGLTRLVDQGKIKLPQLTDAWIKNGDAIREEAAKRQRTNADLRKQFDEDLAYYKGRGFDSQAAVFMAGNKELADFAIRMREVRAGGRDMADVLGKITSEVADQVVVWQRIERQAAAAAAAWGVNGFMGVMDQLQTTMTDLGRVIDTTLGKFVDTDFGRALGNQQERARTMAEAKKELAALRIELKEGSLTVHEYEQRYAQLMTTLNGGQLPTAIKLWHEIKDPMREYKQELETLLKMNREGQFTPEEFRRGLSMVMSRKPVDPQDEMNAKLHEANIRKVAEALRVEREEREKANAEAEEWAKTEKKILDIMNMVQTPQEKVAEQLEELRALYEGGYLSAELYAKAQRKVAEALGSTSKALTESWFSRLKQYEDETKAVNQRVAESFGPIAEEIGKMAAGIETDWHGMVQKLLAELTKLMLIKGMSAAFKGTGFGPAAGSIGGDFVAGLMSAFTGLDSGGQVVARGSKGSTDSELIAFRKNPNETLTVSTPGQQANGMMNASGGGAGGPVSIKNVNVFDPRQAALEMLNSREGDELIRNWVQKNQDFLRGYLVK